MRYFLELRYLGAAYCGWQRQPDMPSVQQTLEQALTTLLRTPIEVVGAGRTDTGVNASYYVAHFDVATAVDDVPRLCFKLNHLLPDDIAVDRITRVDEAFHARFSAREREYRYYIEPRKNPFTRHLTWQYTVPLDVERMNRAAAMLLEYNDFTSFAKLNSNNKTNICRVVRAEWTLVGPDVLGRPDAWARDKVRVRGEASLTGDEWGTDAWANGMRGWDASNTGSLCFTIRADRFLRNMVRSIVGTLVDVGRGRYTPEDFREIVLSRDLYRSSGGAPPQGLFLSDVVYPRELFER